MTQTQNDVRDNIVKITNEKGELLGTGFFFKKGYCITCHHNIADASKIFVGRNGKFHTAYWSEDYSDPRKDIAVLRVKRSSFRPLHCKKEAYLGIDVSVWGYSANELNNFPSGNVIEGRLAKVSCPMHWDRGISDGKQKWNRKPEIDVEVIKFEGSFKKGYSGGPVCYQIDSTVVGMFAAKDDDAGYVIPLDSIFDKLHIKSMITKISSKGGTDTILNKARELTEEGKHEKAIRYFDKIINHENYYQAWFNKGAALGDLNRHKEALACFRRVLDFYKNEPEIWYNMGLISLRLRQFKKAICHFDTCLRLDHEFADALVGKAFALEELGKKNESMKFIQKALKIDPNNADAWNNKGWQLYKRREIRAAMKCYDKAIKIDPKDGGYWSNKALAHQQLGEYDKAISCHNKALRLSPNKAGIWINKALALLDMDDNIGAFDCCLKALQIDSKDAETWEIVEMPLLHLGKRRAADGCHLIARKLKTIKGKKIFPQAELMSYLNKLKSLRDSIR